MKCSGILYSCATPIGNLADCSFRLIDTLRSVDLIAAEDTRVSLKLLQHYDIKASLISLQKFNEADRIHTLFSRLSSGQNVALISDAGTPNIADPGAYVVQQLRERGVSVCVVPGPCAVTAALSISGILANTFYFGGFFPKKASEVSTHIRRIAQISGPIVFFERGDRLLKSLAVLESVFSDNALMLSHCFAAKELTKRHEHFLTAATFSELTDQLTNVSLKGEWVFGFTFHAKETDSSAALEKLKQLDLTASQKVAVATQVLGIPKNKAYSLMHHD